MSIRRSGATVILTYYAKQVGPTPSELRVGVVQVSLRKFALWGETMNEFTGWGKCGDFPDVRIFGSGWGFTVNTFEDGIG